MKKLLVVVAVLLQSLAPAQKAGDKIDVKNIRFDLIEKLFLEKLNQYRQSLSLSTLVTDAILREAARDQALYQQKTNTLTHVQENNGKKRDPSDRVLFYGGTHDRAGENCLYTYVGVPVQDKKTGMTTTIETYAQAAEALFRDWKNSPPHHQNMITPYYENTGLGFALDARTGLLFAVQVFATPPFTAPANGLSYTLSTNGVGTHDEKSCSVPGLEFVSAWLANYTLVKGDSVFITSTSLRTMQKLFSAENDGMAVDIVYRDQFGCRLNHNLHGSPVFDGYMLKPVYKNELMKRNRHARYNAMYSFVCTIPRQAIRPGMQVNTILIKNGRACSYSYPVEGIAGMLPNVLIDPRWCYYEGRLKKGQVAFSQSLEFPFEQNSAVPYETDVLRLSRLLVQFDGAIEKISITTFSSIEGKAALNQKLQNQRLDALRALIDSTLLQKPVLESTAEENWTLFGQQVKNTEWENLVSGKNQEEIRALVNKNIKDPYIRQWLEQQRVARLTLHIHHSYDDNTTPGLLHIPLYDAIRRGDSVQARIASTKLVRAFNSGLIPVDRLDVTDIPLERKYLHVVSNAVAAKILLGDIFGYNGMEEGDEKSVAYITEAFEKFPDFMPLQFNRLVWLTHLYYHGLLQNPEEFAKLEAAIKTFEHSPDVDRTTYESLLFNYYLTGSLFYHDQVLYDKSYECLEKTKPFLLRGQLKEPEIINVSKYFNDFFDYPTSIQLLEDGMKRFPDNNEILFLYVNTGVFYNLTYDKNTDLYYQKLDLFRQRQPKAFCAWIEKNYQLLREEAFQKRFCEDCTGK